MEDTKYKEKQLLNAKCLCQKEVEVLFSSISVLNKRCINSLNSLSIYNTQLGIQRTSKYQEYSTITSEKQSEKYVKFQKLK